jgi:acyl carrier protein
MSEAEALAILRNLLHEEFSVPPAKVTRAATFRGTLGLDSIDVVELVAAVEGRFLVRAVLDDYRQLDSVGKLLDFLLARRSA